ncbi:MAG: hypothetical protein ABSB70_12990 [Candidatus Velthaea sp.]|jgi:hypothetical protein
MSDSETLDGVVSDGVKLAKIMLGALNAAVTHMKPPPEFTDQARSLRRWQIHLSVLMLEVASAAADAAAEGYARSIAILNRSVYKYSTKLKYFSAHHDDAHKQFTTIPIRNYSMLEKATPQTEVALQMSEAADTWREANADRDEYSGNKKLLGMHLAVQKPERILDDRRNPKLKNTREHHTMHDIPSQVVHGEAVLMFDVFDDLDDDDNFNARLRSRIFTVIREISKLVTLLMEFLLTVHKNGTPIPELESLSNQMVAFRARADKF